MNDIHGRYCRSMEKEPLTPIDISIARAECNCREDYVCIACTIAGLLLNEAHHPSCKCHLCTTNILKPAPA